MIFENFKHNASIFLGWAYWQLESMNNRSNHELIVYDSLLPVKKRTEYYIFDFKHNSFKTFARFYLNS